MANKLCLHFIAKNESHCVLRMLNSLKPILDCVVMNDTGSTDNTIEIVKKFGEDNNIPTKIVERPFDTYEKSRNHARETMIEFVRDELKWDLKDCYGFWMDCDEEAQIGKGFSKDYFTKDFYTGFAFIDIKYTRNTWFRLSTGIHWYGPIHEYLITEKGEQVTTGYLPAELFLTIVHTEGASWKGNLSSKYLEHSIILEKYLNEHTEDSRWYFYAGQSWHSCAITPDKQVNDERIRRAIYYYNVRAERPDGYPEERYYSYLRVGELSDSIDEPWEKVMEAYIKAYETDPVRGEQFEKIINHYFINGDYNMAYVYSTFAKNTYHGKNPKDIRKLFIAEHLYNWNFLYLHALCAFNTRHYDDAIASYKELMKIVNRHPEYFNEDTLNLIRTNKVKFDEIEKQMMQDTKKKKK